MKKIKLAANQWIAIEGDDLHFWENESNDIHRIFKVGDIKRIFESEPHRPLEPMRFFWSDYPNDFFNYNTEFYNDGIYIGCKFFPNTIIKKVKELLNETAPIKLSKGKLIERRDDILVLWRTEEERDRNDGRTVEINQIRLFIAKKSQHPEYRYQYTNRPSPFNWDTTWHKNSVQIGCISFTNSDLRKIKKLISDKNIR